MELDGEKSNFTDAWVFLDGQSNGVYELPRRISIVTNNSVNISIQAGIRENGIKSAPKVYPFVDNFIFFTKEAETSKKALFNIIK